jgi:hypothetical protein
MHQIAIDQQTAAKLSGVTVPLNLCDEQGQILGHFVPYPAPIVPADLELDISPEELRRRAEHFQGTPLTDLLGQWRGFSETCDDENCN